MFIKNIKILFFCIVSIALIIAGCGQPDQANTFVVGLNGGCVPYESYDAQGNLEGFDIDLAKALAKKLNKHVFFKDMAFDALIMSLQQGKIDAIISSMSMTEKRQKQITMVHYQGEPLTSLSLLFWGKIPAGLATMEDFKKFPDAEICVEAGTIQEEYLLKFPWVKMKHLDIPQTIMDLKYGKSLTGLVEPCVAAAIVAKYPEVKVLSVPAHVMGNGIGIKKENTKLAKQVEKAVQDLKAEGFITQLEQKWFKGNVNGI